MSGISQQVVAIGRAEAARMRGAVAGHAADFPVTMQASQFATLAKLIESLCEVAEPPRDGDFYDTRYWVPLGEFAKLRQSLAHSQAEPQFTLATLSEGSSLQ